jgi:hypothetical protein
MEELRQIPYDENISLALFDVKSMYTIINTSELPKKTLKLLSTKHGLSTTFTHELTKLTPSIAKPKLFPISRHLSANKRSCHGGTHFLYFFWTISSVYATQHRSIRYSKSPYPWLLPICR